MNKPKYKIVFVVLAYRNTQDLEDFFSYNNVKESHTIVINSFYDEESENQMRIVAEDNGASFLSVPNKGYGAGNNRGIEFALNNFEFEYLVISNADVIIKHLDLCELEKNHGVIIAPCIINLRGKKQNPSVPFRPFKLYEHLRYYLFKGRHKHLIYLVFIYSRLTKIFFHISKAIWNNRVFSAHGAFLIVPKDVLSKLTPLYDEEMFLFNEEEHLGRLAKERRVQTVYVPEIVIRHKEDGSMKIASVNEFEMMRQSYLVYYRKWIRR